jgi:antitoxin (DNA-binding transcriptional repressor) of toxin-antitoxin stability system
MRTVSIARLKDQLSSYLQAVEQGEEIVIRNRKKPVAIILRFPGEDDPDEQQLVLDGKLKVPAREMSKEFWDRFWVKPGAPITLRRMAEVVTEDRREER